MSWLALALLALALVAWWAWEKAHRRTHPVPAGYRPEVSLPHEAEFELHHNALSLCSMKVRVCLAELGIAYRSHPVDLIETGAYENIRRRLLAVNPAGTVPVLVHRGHPVYESHEQIRHAARFAPPGSPSLVPEDPALRAAMEEWIDRSSLTDDPLAHGFASAGNAVPGLTLPLFAAMIDRIPTRRILEGLLFHFDRRRPLMFLLFKAVGLRRFGRLAPALRVMAKSRRQLGVHLDALEKQLVESGGPWILGATFSLADVSWLVIFERLVQADCLHVFANGERRPAGAPRRPAGASRRPACAAYWERLRARPAYAEAIRAHEHPTVVRGTRRLREAKAADPALGAALEGA